MFKVCGNSIWRTGVIRYSGRDGTLTEVCSHLAIGYSLSLGVGGEGIPVD